MIQRNIVGNVFIPRLQTFLFESRFYVYFLNLFLNIIHVWFNVRSKTNSPNLI